MSENMTKNICNAQDIKKLKNYSCPLIIQIIVENKKIIYENAHSSMLISKIISTYAMENMIGGKAFSG